jgi:Protein of unknown function (DUF3617)
MPVLQPFRHLGDGGCVPVCGQFPLCKPPPACQIFRVIPAGVSMARQKLLIGASVGLLLIPGVALAGHGKAGLWNVTNNMSMPNMQIPPEAMAQMKAMGMKMPGAHSVTYQICMTQADVDSNELPKMRKEDGCTAHVTSQTGSSMAADMVCNGEMKGSGQMQVSWSGAERYSGSYHFKGVVEGHPVESSSNFHGDWVKADCGDVKPGSAK